MKDLDLPEERTVEEIEHELEQDGYAEINRIWQLAKRKGYDKATINDAELIRARARHMSLLFGHPWTGFVLLLIVAFICVWFGEYLMSLAFTLPDYFTQKHFQFGQMDRVRFSFANTAAFTVKFFAVFVLLFCLASSIQRYLWIPFNRLLAKELAFSLRKLSWRNYLEGLPESRAFVCELMDRGVNWNWDNADYVARYVPQGDTFVPNPVRTRCEIVLQLLRDFLGSKSSTTRKFESGKYFAQIKGGKGTISKFITEHSELIEALKKEDLNRIECVELLEALLPHLEDSTGKNALLRAIESLKENVFLAENEIQAEIWQREPCADLTHQEEFFSSASLRGVKLMGRGARGRVSPFGYLRNKAISALDFRTRKGRVVRARIAVAEILSGSEKDKLLLFVDGVEGSNTLPSTAALVALLHYAKTCGFKFIAFNALVHNKIPQRFLKQLLARGLAQQQIKIRYFLDQSREYLDAFGIPLQPLEYAQPKGWVIAYALNVDNGSEAIIGIPQTRRNAIWQFIRMNCYWIACWLGGAGGTGVIFYLSVPMGVAALMLFLPLLFLHLRYQRKSLAAK